MGLLAALIVSCGLKGGPPNQGTCSGNLLSGGALAPIAGTGGTPSVASGTVNAYNQGSGNYCINIAGIAYNGPCPSAMIIMAQSGSSYISAGSISVFSGTQNFFFSASTPPAWVYFHCQTDFAAPNGMYARAQLL